MITDKARELLAAAAGTRPNLCYRFGRKLSTRNFDAHRPSLGARRRPAACARASRRRAAPAL